MSRCWIVVPCYNEAERLDEEAFAEFARQHPEVGFLLVNDGSRDDTLARLQELQRRVPEQFDVCHLEQNSGKAEAVRRGILAALQKKPQYVGYWDADLATPLEAIPQYCDVLDRREDVSLVIGTRLRLLGRQIERKRVRRALGRLFALCASSALGLSLYDTQCGAKLFRAGDETASLFAEPFISRWIFDVEIVARMNCLRRAQGGPTAADAIYEWPLEAWREVPGSKLKPRDFARAVWELTQIYRRYRWSHPMPQTVSVGSRGEVADSPTRRAA